MTDVEPVTIESRQEKRAGIRARLIANAEREALRLGRTYTCWVGRHDTCMGHQILKVCLCECHDPGPVGEFEEPAHD